MQLQDIPRPIEGEIISGRYAYDASNDDRPKFREGGPDECFCAIGYLSYHLGLRKQTDLEQFWCGASVEHELAERLGLTHEHIVQLRRQSDAGADFHGVQRVPPAPLIAVVDAHPDLCWSDEYEEAKKDRGAEADEARDQAGDTPSA